MKVKPNLAIGAVQAADIARLERLFSAGADLNALHRGYRPLHALIQTKPHADATTPSAKQLECAQWLIEHGADPELHAAWPPARAILVAAFAGAREYVELLRDAGARVDIYVSAALGDRAAVARALKKTPTVARGRDVGADGGERDGLTALQCAAASRLGRTDAALRARLVEIAQLLIDAGADPNAKTRSWGHDVDAVYFAASAHHVEMFELLLDSGADATEALTPALWNGGALFEPLAAAAMARGANANAALGDKRPLLNDLIRWGQFKPALWLLAHGADPNRPQALDVTDAEGRLTDSGGWTALHQAASRGNVKMVEALIKAGADVTRRDAAGRTPFDIAAAAPLKKLLRR